MSNEGRQIAESLNGERWYAMAPPWSGQFVLSGDEDPHVGRFVCCTDATLHMDGEDLEAYRDDDPATRADFIARHDPATVVGMYEELERLREENVRLREALESVSACAPEYVGGEPYAVGPGVFYAVRRVLGQDHRGRPEALASAVDGEEK